jgi:DNA polymerase-3 subunit beta
MQVNVEQEVLLKGVSDTLGVVDKRGPMPILAHCLVQANGQVLVISATDLDISFRGACPAEVLEPGDSTVHAHTLHSLVKDLPKGNLKITGDEKQIKLETGESCYKLNTFPTEQFPPIPEVEEEGLVDLETKPLLEMVEKTIFSAGDDLQYPLQTIFWERVESKGVSSEQGAVSSEDNDTAHRSQLTAHSSASLRLVSTDGHRLSLAEHPMPEVEQLELGDGILVPTKAMRVIQRFLTNYAQDGRVKLGTDASRKKEGEGNGTKEPKTLFLKAGDKQISVRLVDGKFPEYRRIIPESYDYRFTFKRQELAAALKRVSLLSTDRFRGIIFTLSDGTAELNHENPEVGTGREVLSLESVSGNPESLPLRVGFNARYLLEPLAVMKGETVVMELNEGIRPVRFNDPSAPGALWLVMPMDL